MALLSLGCEIERQNDGSLRRIQPEEVEHGERLLGLSRCRGCDVEEWIDRSLAVDGLERRLEVV